MNNLGFYKYGFNRVVKNYLGLYFYKFANNAYKIDKETYWKYQIKQFGKIYKHALNNVPYYKDYPKIDFSNLSTKDEFLEKISLIPILTKNDLRANIGKHISGSKLLTKVHATSGSTGTPVLIRSTFGEKLKLQMIKNLWFKKISGRYFPKLLILSGYYQTKNRNEIYGKDFLTGDIFLSIHALKPKNLSIIRKLLNDEKPDIIWGYASPVHLLASLFENEQLELKHDINAITTSEVLREEWRERIEANLVRRVYNFYSSQECTHGVFENESGIMKINPIMGLLETLDYKNQRITEGCGKVIGTGYLRKKMPFIRYELGDDVDSYDYNFTEFESPMWPEIGKIYGRSDDLAWKNDGTRVGDLFADRAIKSLGDVIEAQLIQKGYDQFECKLVVKSNSIKENIERHIQASINTNLDADVKIDFIYLPAIKRGKNDKFKSLIVDFEP